MNQDFTTTARTISLMVPEDEGTQRRVQELLAEEKRRDDYQRRQRLEDCIITIPPQYQQPFLPMRSKLSRAVIERVMQWRPTRGALGMGLAGASGLSKTWLMCALLLQLDSRFMFVRAVQIAEAARDKTSPDRLKRDTAVALLNDAATVRTLLLDDLGDEAATECVGETFKDLVEERTSHLRSILWTSNLSPSQISARHGERGKAIMRRLVDFAPVIV